MLSFFSVNCLKILKLLANCKLICLPLKPVVNLNIESLLCLLFCVFQAYLVYSIRLWVFRPFADPLATVQLVPWRDNPGSIGTTRFFLRGCSVQTILINLNVRFNLVVASLWMEPKIEKPSPLRCCLLIMEAD